MTTPYDGGPWYIDGWWLSADLIESLMEETGQPAVDKDEKGRPTTLLGRPIIWED